MTILVTGSAGHLGEGLMRVLRDAGRPALGLDIKPSPYTDILGSITDRDLLKRVFEDVRSVIHTATLHKPHVATHAAQDFIDTNVTGTLCLLEAAMQAQVEAFVFTSTTSTFGLALSPAPDEPAAWITEAVRGTFRAALTASSINFLVRSPARYAFLKSSASRPELMYSPDARAAGTFRSALSRAVWMAVIMRFVFSRSPTHLSMSISCPS